MPKSKRLHHGVGAKISIYMMLLQPKAMDFAKYSNASKIDALGDLWIVGHEEKGVCKVGQDFFTAFHTDFDDRHIRSVVTRLSSFNQEGPH